MYFVKDCHDFFNLQMQLLCTIQDVFAAEDNCIQCNYLKQWTRVRKFCKKGTSYFCASIQYCKHYNTHTCCASDLNAQPRLWMLAVIATHFNQPPAALVHSSEARKQTEESKTLLPLGFLMNLKRKPWGFIQPVLQHQHSATTGAPEGQAAKMSTHKQELKLGYKCTFTKLY